MKPLLGSPKVAGMFLVFLGPAQFLQAAQKSGRRFLFFFFFFLLQAHTSRVGKGPHTRDSKMVGVCWVCQSG